MGHIGARWTRGCDGGGRGFIHGPLEGLESEATDAPPGGSPCDVEAWASSTAKAGVPSVSEKSDGVLDFVA